MKSSTIIATSLGGVAAFAVGLALVVTAQQPAIESATFTTAPETTQSAPATTPMPAETTDAQIESLLVYLIEEEKLAHDVYTALADTWGSRVFTNISESESQHQSQVESLLVQFGIDNPRSSTLGVFVNDELQALYDSLLEQGSRSIGDAMDVGILIEETDIRDLQIAIDEIDNSDIDVVLTRLLNASENHLAAFSRQD